jgi:polar amino acid transport system substrate-binding protein
MGPRLMHRRDLLALGASAMAVPWADAQPAGADKPLLLVNALYPPFVNAPGHPRGEGIDIDIAREALRRGGGRYKLDVQIVPWKRALFMLEHGVADFTTTVAYTPERDRFLAWSGAYRSHIAYHFYSRKGANVSVRRIEDVARYRLGLSAGFFYPQPIRQQAGSRIEQAKDIATVVKLLLTDRVDLIVISNYAGAWEIREQGVADQLDVQPFEFPNENQAFMAFSRARPNPVALAAMTAGLASMVRDGTVARLEQKYLSAP